MTQKGWVRVVRQNDWIVLWPILLERGSDPEELLVKARFDRLLRQPEHCLMVALINNKLVGYAWAQNYGAHLRTGKITARLHDLFVLESHRRKGLGTLLFHAVADWVKKQGVTWLQWESNYSGVPFYKKLGYKGDPCPNPQTPFFQIEFPI